MKKLNLEISKTNKTVSGFTVKEGFITFSDADNNIFGITSGWNDGYLLYVYTRQDGEWVGGWEDDENFPVEEALEAIEKYQKQKEMEEMKTEIEKLLKDGVSLYVSSEPIRFTDEVAGEKSSDGGEYGFYSTYYPTSLEGVYELHTSTTCEFDRCGTGYEGLVVLTQDRYEYLVNEEKVILEGR